jgi:hypothetical protein
MWGFHIVESHRSLADAQEQFERALASGKERPYVRQLQLAALLYYIDERFEEEVMRVVSDMRLNREPLPSGDLDYSVRWSKLWKVYYSRVLNGNEQQAFFSALSPSDHLATFQWLFPEDIVPESKRNLYRFFLGSFQELAGNYTSALTTFGSLQKSLGKEHGGGHLPDKTTEAITRLSQLNRTGKTQKMGSE